MVMLDGPKLRRIREAKNLRQSDVAEAANTSERYIRDLESGRKRDPSARIVYGCASCLGVAMEELMTVLEEDI